MEVLTFTVLVSLQNFVLQEKRLLITFKWIMCKPRRLDVLMFCKCLKMNFARVVNQQKFMQESVFNKVPSYSLYLYFLLLLIVIAVSGTSLNTQGDNSQIFMAQSPYCIPRHSPYQNLLPLRSQHFLKMHIRNVFLNY